MSLPQAPARHTREIDVCDLAALLTSKKDFRVNNIDLKPRKFPNPIFLAIAITAAFLFIVFDLLSFFDSGIVFSFSTLRNPSWLFYFG
jgi:hypothetical protein